MLHRVESAVVVADGGGEAARQLALVVGFKRDHVKPLPAHRQGARFLGADGQVAGHGAPRDIHDGHSVRRRKRDIGFGVVGEGDAHRLVETGGQGVRVEVLNGGDHLVEGRAGRIGVDDADGIRHMVGHPHFRAVGPCRHAHRIDAHVDSRRHRQCFRVDDVQRVGRRVGDIHMVADQRDGPGVGACESGMAYIAWRGGCAECARGQQRDGEKGATSGAPHPSPRRRGCGTGMG